jgi:hypothetical protein
LRLPIQLPDPDARPDVRHAASIAVIMALGAFILHGMGQALWCRGGQTFLWASSIWSEHNSQHLADPYTFTHVLHGVLLYGLLWVLLRNRVGVAWRGVIAIGLQVGWEILENTDLVIQRYRETTISLNYYGDSVGNSLGDITACLLGYTLAAVFPAWVSVAGFVAVDVALLFWIRDSLLLNVIMLVWPIEAVRTWQMGGVA